MASATSPPTSETTALVAPARAKRRFNIQRYGTLLFFLAFFLVVTIVKGTTFLSVDNLLLIIAQNSHLIIAACALTIALIAGQFDLSVGGLLALAAVLTAGFMGKNGIPLLPTIVLVVVVGALVGLVNGLLVTRAHVTAFIATLGTGGVLTGIALLYSGNAALYTGISPRLIEAGTSKLIGIPLPAIYALIGVIVLWAMSTQYTIGRSWYAAGSSPAAARLAGIKVERMTVWAFLVTGVAVSIAGVVFTARFGSADPTSGAGYLLPAFAGAFLGTAVVSKGGRFTVLGAAIATVLIAWANNGLDVLGLASGVKEIFNGGVLVGAVALNELLTRMRAPRTGDA